MDLRYRDPRNPILSWNGLAIMESYGETTVFWKVIQTLVLVTGLTLGGIELTGEHAAQILYAEMVAQSVRASLDQDTKCAYQCGFG